MGTICAPLCSIIFKEMFKLIDVYPYVRDETIDDTEMIYF